MNIANTVTALTAKARTETHVYVLMCLFGADWGATGTFNTLEAAEARVVRGVDGARFWRIIEVGGLPLPPIEGEV